MSNLSESSKKGFGLLPRNANEFIEQQLDERNLKIESKFAQMQ
jgi:hypothetical protein